MVRVTGLEPARGAHQILSLARLPIPPYPRIEYHCILMQTPDKVKKIICTCTFRKHLLYLYATNKRSEYNNV